MARSGRSALFQRLVNGAGVTDYCSSEATVGDAFDMAFDLLKVLGRRDEYVYRAAISHKILLGRHSLNTASMLTEFRAGSSKADIVILNGTATVYEIKSERDSLARLSNQIENYRQVFAQVNVIASETHIEEVLSTVPDDIGVMHLSKRYQISTVREAANRPDCVQPLVVFESLRSEEAVAVLKALGITPPNVPNTRRHEALRELFEDLDPTTLHSAVVQTLKQTRSLVSRNDLVRALPRSLHAAALSIAVRRADHGRLIEAVNTPLSLVKAWN